MRYQWQALTAHRSNKGYKFQNHICALATEDNYKILENGVEKPDMTVYVKTISGKTITVNCDRRQNAKRIMEILERKTSIPRDQLYLVNQGKVLIEKKTIEESNIEAGATIEMSLRIKGGMEKEELMETSETEEEIIRKWKLIELSESKPSRLSEDVLYLRKEISNANKRSDEKVENFSKRTEEHMESCSNRTDEKMDKFLQSITNSVGLQILGTNSTIDKLREEGGDRHNQIDERIANMEKKFSMIDETSKI